jgi:predicted amidohydrolase YtcJ
MRICTLHGAYASFEKESKGTITPGKLADFVVLTVSWQDSCGPAP